MKCVQNVLLASILLGCASTGLSARLWSVDVPLSEDRTAVISCDGEQIFRGEAGRVVGYHGSHLVVELLHGRDQGRELHLSFSQLCDGWEDDQPEWLELRQAVVTALVQERQVMARRLTAQPAKTSCACRARSEIDRSLVCDLELQVADVRLGSAVSDCRRETQRDVVRSLLGEFRGATRREFARVGQLIPALEAVD